jgi:hypothetical protein
VVWREVIEKTLVKIVPEENARREFGPRHGGHATDTSQDVITLVRNRPSGYPSEAFDEFGAFRGDEAEGFGGEFGTEGVPIVLGLRVSKEARLPVAGEMQASTERLNDPVVIWIEP